MVQPESRALLSLRNEILSPDSLVRAVASGRRRGMTPQWRRVEMRYVDLAAGRHLQVTTYDDTQAHVANYAEPRELVDELLHEPFANWHVDTTTHTHQLRITKKGQALLHSAAVKSERTATHAHNREKQRLLPADDPVFAALGLADAKGRIRDKWQHKYRQVEDFLRILDAAIDDAGDKLPADRPVHIVDLGCGNAYLTFAAHAYLARQRQLPARFTGVDVKRQSFERNQAIAEQLDATDQVSFVESGIADVEVEHPDIVLALHACDTATDDALARAIGWQTPVILAAPCCHHDLSAQLRRQPPPVGYEMFTRDGILRERFADTLTDALRASLLRAHGYRVNVMEFVDSAHTPRNTLLRALRTGAENQQAGEEYATMTATWDVRPRLAELLG